MHLSKVLADKLAYYVNNPSKRCEEHGDCYYSGKTLGIDTDGCFIGSFLKPEDALMLDEEAVASVEDALHLYPNIFPEWMKGHATLLGRFQQLHDDINCWNISTTPKQKGLSLEGKCFLEEIISTFELNKSLFEKFLN